MRQTAPRPPTSSTGPQGGRRARRHRKLPPVLRLALRPREAHSREMSPIAVACLIAAQPAGIAIAHVTVVDVHHGRLLADQSVVIAGNKITVAGPSRRVQPP